MKRIHSFVTAGSLALAVLSNPANAATYYVNSSGSDSNPGTQAAPWKTIAKVNSMIFRSGDQILFRGGQTFTGPLTFTASSYGTSTNPIIVSSYGTGAATISSTGDGIDITDTQGFSINNLIVDGGNHSTNTGNGIMLVNDLSTNVTLGSVNINNVTVSNFGYQGIVLYSWNGNGGWNSVNITYCTSFGNEDGVQSWGDANYKFQNILVDHVVAHDNAGRSGQNNPTGSGIVLGQTNGATIQHCVAYGNGASNTNTAGPVGIWCYDSNNVTIQYCESYNNTGGTGLDGDGFDLDINTTYSTIQYCFSHGNTGSGYLIGGQGTVGGNKIQYNVSQLDGTTHSYGGITVWGTAYNDVVQSNWIFAEAPSQTGIRISGGTAMSNFKFLNNTIFVTGNLPIIIGDVTAGVTFAGNDYWRTDGSFLVSWAGVQYTSLAAWQNASGQEAGTGYNQNPTSLLKMPTTVPVH